MASEGAAVPSPGVTTAGTGSPLLRQLWVPFLGVGRYSKYEEEGYGECSHVQIRGGSTEPGMGCPS